MAAMAWRLPTQLATPGKLHHHNDSKTTEYQSSFSWCRTLAADHLLPSSSSFSTRIGSSGTPVRPTSILVVGATGTLGRQIVRRALDEGYDVRCLVRPRPAPADFLRDWGATVVNTLANQRPYLSKPETIPATLIGIHTVIDCATGRPEEPIKTVDWEGKVALIQCAKVMQG
ncbi:unnamed protein product [Prunus armeniaca]|uniref:NmrA-like domain-containing protein n=1 Tax=Prunus armeniaca TaxID=36596 RepID=A0A6J5Y5B2_PRUAR|nr:unnamed protein product [Prunus armeniaca]CAB4321296.1 unnamed protein product [Prunus armeniaca]